ncbi:LysR family transcriptional regulator [Agrobacterium rubi]|uniref:LysR family transcriptional regulator n=1 Tax=Agrobacterium rubi TaxID=28099 RepID=UPI0015749C92|nr:LysR family transcriptional regulator [Agrobacterium rubi]NTF08519.1 LysR family transcriptional regulator [Agrobacterium rubi]NTF20747.1 LysR family transcriptional regulator [Agrobacterium rubi]NTF29773.1 LysR family transcriptional regulator [Agrobacterium rubi]
MNLRALMYFDELVRTSSMRAAAENLNVAPTAISRQIENLEEYFGTPLVERSSRGVTLTAAGELLAERAGKTLRELGHVHQLIDDLKGLERGRATIYANGATVASLLAPALSQFSQTYPKLRFEVHITSARQAIDALVSAQADIAITLFAPKTSEVKILAKREIGYDVILPAGHPLADKPSISLKDLAAIPLALPEKTFAARQAFDALFAQAGIALDPTFTASSLELLKDLVLDGAAVTLLPPLSVAREIDAGRMVAVPLGGSKGVRTTMELCVAPDRELSFAAAMLASFIETFMGSLPK